MSIVATLLGARSIVESIGQAPPNYPKRSYGWYADRAKRRTAEARRQPFLERPSRCS